MNPLLELLAHTAWKGASVLLLALTAGLLLRRTAASRRYAVWITTVTVLALLPFAMSLLPAWRVLPKPTAQITFPPLEEQPRPAEVPQVRPEIQLPKLVPKPVTKAANSPTLTVAQAKVSWKHYLQYLPYLWLTVSMMLLVRLGWGAFRLGRLERSLPLAEHDEIALIASEIGLRRAPQLLLGPADAVPMVWGIFRPRLLLPLGFKEWSMEKRRGVLLHELAHLKRRDPLALWVAQWVKALHWFNPLAWLTIHLLRADQERACDDTALRHGVRPSDYAQALLDLSRHSRAAPGLALCALTITRSAPVESRVKAILELNRSRDPITGRWLAGLGGLALLILLPVAMLSAMESAKVRGRILDRNGAVLAETTASKIRHYPLKSTASHLIGFTRQSAAKNTPQIGGAGLEKQYNDMLQSGKDLSCSLDARIQTLVTRAMSEAGVTRGAAIVLDPRTGEILASVSLPSYDPNVFIPSISQADWDSLSENKDMPLLNRSIRGYAPGSAYMPLIGMAGISAGVGGQKFDCTGSVTYGKNSMQCWIQRQSGGSHGLLNLSQALVTTCNCYWYQFGNATGIQEIEKMGYKIGFGARYGLSDEEDTGILPCPAWLKEQQPKEQWSDEYTANTSIGQGSVLSTPLQMAVLAATVGNGGKVPQPTLLKQDGENAWRADLTTEGLTAAQIEPLREGMRLVVNGAAGTAQLARSDKVMIAGKTGTAQNWRRVGNLRTEDNNVWFIGFAPFDNPRLAFAILKQGGKSGGADCAPIAKRIVEETLALAEQSPAMIKAAPKKNTANLLNQKEIYDPQGELILHALKSGAPAANTGFEMTSFKAFSGKVQIEGIASGMIQALEYRKQMIEIGQRWNIEWEFPVPATMEDGRRVTFYAEGLFPEAAVVAKQKMLEEETNSRLSPSERFKKIHIEHLTDLFKKASLPALPEGAKMGILKFKGLVSFDQSAFIAPRGIALEWLQKSLSSQQLPAPDWPPEPQAFKRRYVSQKHEIIAESEDGKTVKISVSKTPKIDLSPPRSAPESAPGAPRGKIIKIATE